MAKKVLILFFSLIAISMIVVTIHTSMIVSLFDVLPRLIHDPWTAATLTDFYFNILILSSWAFYKEKNKLVFFLWFVAFVALGSIATSIYVIVQLLKLKPGEPLGHALVRRD